MNRREAISRVALIMGGTIISAEYFLSGCKPAPVKVTELFDKQHIKFLDEVGDTILPATKTPGAKDVHIGSFMALMVRDCYNPENQQIFINGVAQLNDGCKQKYNKDFLDCSLAQRTEFLTLLDKEQKEYTHNKKEEQPHHYFRMMKELTLLGYFTSEQGCTLALRYLPVPGKYDGSMPYKKGDKAWATA
ncbi:MAG: gluconate 2-dehydrogenase subunit 3 family protein [Mucilaginibacter sp.]|nr:gluconate 2-dehydrogenase subunit 3 family protein [Mucilaginibacter sp.]